MFAYSWFQVERKWVIWDIFGLTLQSQPYDSKQNIYLKHWKCSISEEIDCIQRRKVCHERMSMETWCWTPAEYKYRKPVWQYELTWGDNATLQGFKMCKKSILIMIRAAVLTAILPVHLSEAEVATFCAQRFWGRCSL